MKAVILAGGLGTRLSEETSSRPKPLIEIGGKPILWHIMKLYSHFGVRDFIICCGYKGYLVKEYFSNYSLHMTDVTFDMVENKIELHQTHVEPWRVTLVDTGENTMTGGRLKRVRAYLEDEPFCFTYGDGVGDIDLGALLQFHRSHGCPATITAVRPPARFGALQINGKGTVTSFKEKPEGESGYINGGFFVLQPSALDLISGDSISWEIEPLQTLVSRGELKAFPHKGFWQPMDTLRDKNYLESLWQKDEAPWKMWP